MPLVPPDVELSEDQTMLIDAAREFARNELLPLDRKWDEDESTVAEVLPQLGEMGLLNICLPEELNGLGCPYSTYAAILHEISVWSPSTAVTISVHSMVGHILEKYLAEPQRTEWLSAWGDPSSFAAFALTEANAGSDAGGTQAAAHEVDGGLKINGEKMWISNGLAGRWFLTLVRLQDGPQRDNLCAVLIDGNEPGVERTKIAGKMGIRGSETAVIHLTDAFVPEHRIIGERGQGLQTFLTTLNEGRIGIASQASGIAEACLDEMVGYARRNDRQQHCGAGGGQGTHLASGLHGGCQPCQSGRQLDGQAVRQRVCQSDCVPGGAGSRRIGIRSRIPRGTALQGCAGHHDLRGNQRDSTAGDRARPRSERGDTVWGLARMMPPQAIIDFNALAREMSDAKRRRP
ncbi:MAG: acyl-CoA dehydrogenase family protein [Planctomycetota bacterium]|jgi:alkylation response protein AidB-like acyl-CoA dehydrogenase